MLRDIGPVRRSQDTPSTASKRRRVTAAEAEDATLRVTPRVTTEGQFARKCSGRVTFAVQARSPTGSSGSARYSAKLDPRVYRTQSTLPHGSPFAARSTY
jgi:hypothetical protein